MTSNKSWGFLVGAAAGGLFGNIAGNYFMGLLIGGVVGMLAFGMIEGPSNDDGHEREDGPDETKD